MNNIRTSMKELHCKVCLEKFNGPHRLIEALVHLKYNHQKIFDSKLKGITDGPDVFQPIDSSSTVVTGSSSQKSFFNISTQTDNFFQEKKTCSLSRSTDENRIVFPPPGNMSKYFVIADARAEMPYMCLLCWKKLLNLKMCVVHLLRTHSISLKQKHSDVCYPHKHQTSLLLTGEDESSCSRTARNSQGLVRLRKASFRRKSSALNKVLRTSDVRKKIARVREIRRLSKVKLALLRQQCKERAASPSSSPSCVSPPHPNDLLSLSSNASVSSSCAWTPTKTSPSLSGTESTSWNKISKESVWNSLSFNSAKQLAQKNSLTCSRPRKLSSSPPSTKQSNSGGGMGGSLADNVTVKRCFKTVSVSRSRSSDGTITCWRSDANSGKLVSNEARKVDSTPRSGKRTARKSTRLTRDPRQGSISFTVEGYLKTSENLKFVERTSGGAPVVKAEGRSPNRTAAQPTPPFSRSPNSLNSSLLIGALPRPTVKKPTGRKSISGRT